MINNLYYHRRLLLIIDTFLITNIEIWFSNKYEKNNLKEIKD